MARMVHCIKLGREAEGLDFPRCRRTRQKLWENRQQGGLGGWQKHRRCWSTRTGSTWPMRAPAST